jgi:hypothetical protein
MNVKDTVKRSLLLYPSVSVNALAVYEHLFCTNGNGYEWKNGELVEITTTDYTDSPVGNVPTMQQAIEKSLQFHLRESIDMLGFARTRCEMNCITSGKSEDEITEDDVVNEYNRSLYVDISEDVDLIFKTEERLNDFDVPTLDRYPEIFMKNYEFRLYGICEYSKLCNLPDDIKPDWLDAAERMLDFIKTHPETWRKDYEEEYNKWIPKIEARIEELKNK